MLAEKLSAISDEHIWIKGEINNLIGGMRQFKEINKKRLANREQIVLNRLSEFWREKMGL